jgi:hypothetical protein
VHQFSDERAGAGRPTVSLFVAISKLIAKQAIHPGQRRQCLLCRLDCRLPPFRRSYDPPDFHGDRVCFS